MTARLTYPFKMPGRAHTGSDITQSQTNGPDRANYILPMPTKRLKPISLAPLTWEQALSAAMKVKPPAKAVKTKKSKPKK